MTRLFFRLLAAADAAWLALRALKSRGRRAVPAGAGIHNQAVAVQELEGVAWPGFTSLAHSFWRAQELTLFRNHRQLFATPVLDLGCGDGIFAELAGFPPEGIGTDIDLESLQAAKRRGFAMPVVQSDAGAFPVRGEGVAACLSNSVLEHLPDLDRCFSEVARSLRRGGRFIFTMTLGVFTEHLRRLSGESDAKRWVGTFGHLQEPTLPALAELLMRHGLEIEKAQEYQPPGATAAYRLLVSPVFQFIERKAGGGFRRRLQRSLANRVKRSLEPVSEGQGACCFIVARKR